MFNRKSSNSFSIFYFPFETLSDLANNLGWKAYYIGDWGHSRNQKMIKFLAV